LPDRRESVAQHDVLHCCRVRRALGQQYASRNSRASGSPAELSVKIARQSCRRFTLAGVLPEGNALINVTQSRDQRVVGGLSVLAMAEERK